jgi:hypothetical protein
MAIQLLYLPTSTVPPTPTSVAQSTTQSDMSHSATSPSLTRKKTLHLLIGYESGQVALLEFTPTRNFTTSATDAAEIATPEAPPSETSDERQTEDVSFPISGRMIEENEGWSLVWIEKCHRDAGTLPTYALTLLPSPLAQPRMTQLTLC